MCVYPASSRFLLSLILAATGLAGQTVAAGGSRHALLVGNSNYNKLPQLRSSQKDVAELEAALKEAGFDVQAVHDLGLSALADQTWPAFLEKLKAGDTCFIYYSGYIVQFKRDNYMLPVDFDPKSEEKVDSLAQSLTGWQQNLDEKQIGLKILVVQGAPAPGEVQGSLEIGFANPNLSTKETLFSFSSPPGQPIVDRSENDIGLFTESIVENIKKPGLRVEEVFFHAQQQAPVYFLPNGITKTFYFHEPVAPPVVVAPPVAPRTPEVKPGENRENSKDLLTYAWIPNGTFKMGCVESDRACQKDESPQHDVVIEKGFWMTRTEVTTGAYQRFTRQTGHREPKATQTNPKRAGTDLPITQVNWEDAKVYCEWAGGRLPTEAEWEYAARGGKQNLKYPWGNDFNSQLANSFKTDRRVYKPFTETLPVRTLGTGNGYDLFDMVGNVREWTSDPYDKDAYSHLNTPASGKDRVVRGGSFNGSDKDLRISARDHFDGTKEDNQTGFRCVVPALNQN